VTEGEAARRSRREVAATVAIVGFFAALAVGRPIARRFAKHPTPERCVAMLERWSEQEARSRNRQPTPAHVAVDAPDVRRCTDDLTEAEVDCALKAGHVDELERCLHQ
jgi:hypothetical protein